MQVAVGKAAVLLGMGLAETQLKMADDAALIRPTACLKCQPKIGRLLISLRICKRTFEWVAVISPVKLSLKTNIPAKSSGRLLDALTDVIRPFTERMGLKADLIRLQREEVALNVAMLAAERIKNERKPIVPVPIKTITRLLEAASLEEPNDETMIRLWGNLLASSAIGAENNVPRYVSILSDINGQQARLIQEIFTKQGKIKTFMDADLLSDDLMNMDQSGVMNSLRQLTRNITPATIRKVIKNYLDQPGVAIADIIISKGMDQWDSGAGLFPVDKHRKDLDVLESLSLVRDRTFKDARFHAFEIFVPFYCASDLCIDMFAACNPKMMRRREGIEAMAQSYQMGRRRRETRRNLPKA